MKLRVLLKMREGVFNKIVCPVFMTAEEFLWWDIFLADLKFAIKIQNNIYGSDFSPLKGLIPSYVHLYGSDWHWQTH